MVLVEALPTEHHLIPLALPVRAKQRQTYTTIHKHKTSGRSQAGRPLILTHASLCIYRPSHCQVFSCFRMYTMAKLYGLVTGCLAKSHDLM